MNLLSIINSVRGLFGDRTVSAAFSSTDPRVVQMVAIANEEAGDLASRRLWTALIRESSFTTVAGADQGLIDGSIVPTSNAFDFIINDTIFNRTLRIPVFGPLSPGTYQARKALQSLGPYSQFRIRAGRLLFDPVPSVGHSCYFEYKTRNLVTDVTGVTERETWASDTDIPMLDSRLMLQGIKWRWKAAKGMDYAEDMASYENQVMDAMARDGNRPRLNLNGGGRSGSLEPFVIIPAGNWNQV